MFPTSKFKTLTILTLIVVFVLVLSIWLMYQHFFGEGILSKLGIKKGYSEETLTIADDTMNIIAKESTLKELIGYYEKNKHEISLPDWAIKLMYEIFDCIYPSDGKNI